MFPLLPVFGPGMLYRHLYGCRRLLTRAAAGEEGAAGFAGSDFGSPLNISAIVRFGWREDLAAGAAAFGAAAAGALPCCCCRPPPSLLCCCCCGAGACCFGAPHALVVGTADGVVVVVVVACCPAGAGASSRSPCLPFPWLLLLCVADPERAPLSPPLSRRDDDDDGSPPPPLLSVPRSRLDDFSPSLGPHAGEKDLLLNAFRLIVVCLIIRCCFNNVVRVRSDDDIMNKGNHQRDDDSVPYRILRAC